MELEIITTVFIDINEIIEAHHLDYNSSDKGIKWAVDSYVAGLDDADFYLIGAEEKEKIKKEIRTKIGEQMKLFKEV